MTSPLLIPSRSLMLGLDQGSSSTKALLLSHQGEVLFGCIEDIEIQKISSIESEQDPREILISVKRCLTQAIKFAEKANYKIVGMGLACQRSGVCSWKISDRSPVSKLLPWSDRRTFQRIDKIRSKHNLIKQKTMIPITPHYAGPKIALLQERFVDSDLRVGTLDSFLVESLTDGATICTEDTMAARTMLYCLASHNWDDELCDIFEVNKERLVRIAPSLSHHGSICGIPLVAMIGDQQAALLCQYLNYNKKVLNLGSVASLSLVTESSIEFIDGFVPSVLYSYRENGENKFKYLIEGIINASGSIIDHIINNLKLAKSLDEINQISLSEMRQENRYENIAVAFYPLNGSATPDWEDNLSSYEENCSLDSPERYIRALIDNIAHFIFRTFQIMRNKSPQEFVDGKLVVTGGITKITYLLQYLANLTGLDLEVPYDMQASARGAALAGAISLYGFENAKQLAPQKAGQIIKADGQPDLTRYENWMRLYQRSKANRV